MSGKSLLAIVVGAMLVAPAATLAEDGYDSHTWTPAHDGSGLFVTYGTETLRAHDFFASMSIDYARNPMVLQVGGGDPIASLIDRATTMELGVFYGLPKNFEAGVVVPFALRGYPNPVDAENRSGVANAGIGDFRLEGKWRALAQKGYVPSVAVIGGFSTPTGDETSWFGSGVFQPMLALAGQERIGPVDLLANVGYRFHPGEGTRVWGQRVDDQLFYKGGAGWDIGFQDLVVLGEFTGAMTKGGGVAPLEAGIGVRRPIIYGVTAAAGANYGFADSMGTPAWRGFVLLSWDSGALKNNRRSIASTPIAPELKGQVTPTPKPTPLVVVVPTPAPTPITIVKVTPTPVPTPVKRVTVTETEIEIPETIHFRRNLATIDPESYFVLDQVVEALKAHPEITKLSIEGHTDNTGPGIFNLLLSKARANSVRSYLVKKGIKENIFETVGYGAQKPITTNKTKEGRAINRRVEFVIVKRK